MGGGTWLAAPDNTDKRWGELFFLKYCVGWVAFFGAIVATGVYHDFNDAAYMAVGLVVALPALILPPLVCPTSAANPSPFALHSTWRYWVKANVWVGIVSWIGNYHLTHYFFLVLGARYSFPNMHWTVNAGVPVALILITHGYFFLYFTVGAMVLRRMGLADRWLHTKPPTGKGQHGDPRGMGLGRVVGDVALLLVLGYVTAVLEAVTIASVPYYNFADPHAFLVYGSAFYMLMLTVCFPMFLRIDEDTHTPHTLLQTVFEALATCMAVLMLYDAWRTMLGPITAFPPPPQFPLPPFAAALLGHTENEL